MSDDAKDLVSKLLVVDPASSLGTKEILNHRWFVKDTVGGGVWWLGREWGDNDTDNSDKKAEEEKGALRRKCSDKHNNAAEEEKLEAKEARLDLIL